MKQMTIDKLQHAQLSNRSHTTVHSQVNGGGLTSFQFSRFLYIVGLLQVAALSFLSDSTTVVIILQLALFSCLFIASRPLLRFVYVPGLAEHFWATWSIGGFGMLLGHQLDSYWLPNVAQSHLHHGHHAGQVAEVGINQIVNLLLSGMTMVMLLFCVPACLFLCNRCLHHCSRAAKWLLHGGSTVFMLLGMLLASISQQWLVQDNEPSAVVAHYYMLILMVVASTTAYYGINKLIQTRSF